MKRVVSLMMAVMMLVGAASTANAGFKIGPRVGLNVNKIHFDNGNNLLDASNNCGFTGGVQLEYLTFLNIGFDVSLMYSYMGSDINWKDLSVSPNSGTDTGKHFLEIPLNLKYKIGIPMLSKIFAPYVFTGPSVAFKLDKGNEYLKTKTSQWTWNLGLGLEFINHLQIGASYGFGINNIMDGVSIPVVGTVNTKNLKARNNYWTVTAAWLF